MDQIDNSKKSTISNNQTNLNSNGEKPIIWNDVNVRNIKYPNNNFTTVEINEAANLRCGISFNSSLARDQSVEIWLTFVTKLVQNIIGEYLWLEKLKWNGET